MKNKSVVISSQILIIPIFIIFFAFQMYWLSIGFGNVDIQQGIKSIGQWIAGLANKQDSLETCSEDGFYDCNCCCCGEPGFHDVEGGLVQS